MIKAATVLDITSSQEYHSMLNVKSTEVAHSLPTYNGIDRFTVCLLACLVSDMGGAFLSGDWGFHAWQPHFSEMISSSSVTFADQTYSLSHCLSVNAASDTYSYTPYSLYFSFSSLIP